MAVGAEVLVAEAAHVVDVLQLLGDVGVVGLLGAGKYLGAQVGLHATADRAAHERGFWVHIVQWTSTHPILTWRAHALRDRSRPGRLMMRPKTAWYPPVSPAGGVGSEAWPTPADVLARMDRSAPRVPGAEEQFGRYPGMFYAVGRDELRLSDPTPLFTPPDVNHRRPCDGWLGNANRLNGHVPRTAAVRLRTRLNRSQ